MPHFTLARRPTLTAAFALACLVALVFFPVVGFEFVDIDVPVQVINNQYIRALSVENLKEIATSRCLTSYYPVRTLTYALDYRLWGLEPGGFKSTNALIHLLNVLLVFWLILRLFRESVPGDRPPPGSGELDRNWPETFAAAFSAALFAVHPVVVEPVAWVAGREELLMVLGTLGCIHFHLTARRLAAKQAKIPLLLICYTGAAVSCAVACLSNAVAAVIPAIVTAWDALTLARPTLWRILRGTAVLWAIGIATLVIKKVGEFIDPVGESATFSLNRLALVLETYWLNLKTLVWPVDLAAFREVGRPESWQEPTVLLGAVAVGITCTILWMLRSQRIIVFGLLWFLAALAPSSQVMPHHIHRADRFLYLPLAGLVVAIAVAARPLGSTLVKKYRGSAALAGTLILVAMASASAVQLQTWRSPLTMWEKCVQVDADNGLAHCRLAGHLVERGHYRRGISHYEKAIELPPWTSMARSQLAILLATCRDEEFLDFDRAIYQATLAWQESSRYLRTVTAVYTHSAEYLAAHGESAEAIENYRQALTFHPLNRPALLELAHLLTTCNEEGLRDPEEALRLAQRACEMDFPPTARDLQILAAAYAQTGRIDEAAATREAARLIKGGAK